ncbi:MAG TPA: cobalamin-independent methionine synthase II family protein [Chloroflexota bacterium]
MATPRAETVGSLLRPDYLKKAREERLAERLSTTELEAVEDRAVGEAIALQEQAGLDVITDGEMRRQSWITTIPIMADRLHEPPLAGYEYHVPDQPGWFAFWRDESGQFVRFRANVPRAFVTEKLRFVHDLIGREYPFLKAHAQARTKYSFPAPSYHRVFWHPQHSRAAYPTVDEFLADVAALLKEHLVRPLLELGCDYIQLDAPNYGQFYVDGDVRAALEQEGHDLDAELLADADLDSALFEGVSGVTRALHVCRGNGPGGIWSASGGYEPLGPAFQRLRNIDTLLLEYDTERSGDFAPLHHVLPDSVVVLGLLTTKRGALESAEALAARTHEATRYVPLERLAISPQCGFNSAGIGNSLTYDEQAAKLRRVAEVARRVFVSS